MAAEKAKQAGSTKQLPVLKESLPSPAAPEEDETATEVSEEKRKLLAVEKRKMMAMLSKQQSKQRSMHSLAVPESGGTDLEAGKAPTVGEQLAEDSCCTSVCRGLQACCIGLTSIGGLAPLLIDLMDANAIACVGLVLFPLMGAVSWLVYHRGNAFDAFGVYLLSGGDGDADLAPPAPPANPDWANIASSAALAFGVAHPLEYLLIDLGGAFALGIVILFWKDISELWASVGRRVTAVSTAFEGSGSAVMLPL